MEYKDRLSQKCVPFLPHWPPSYWIEQEIDESIIEAELAQVNFNLEEWLKYKLQVPNDGQTRDCHHPEIEYALTKEELQAYEKDEVMLCNPFLCAKRWKNSSKSLGEVSKRFQWLLWQENWVTWGYPTLPKIIKKSFTKFVLIFNKLVYQPFIQYWGDLPDDFWIKLSRYLEDDNQESLHIGFILQFKKDGRIFPPPYLMDEIEENDNESLYLPPSFWD